MPDYALRALDQLNCLALPASARYFAHADREEQWLAAVDFARDRALPLFVLGGGSNVVLGGRFPGLVLQLGNDGVEVLDANADGITLRVAAGQNWHGLVEHCLRQGWRGLENLALIPGSVGAAPIQNIGAYGVEFSQFCTAVEVVEIVSSRVDVIAAPDCRFGYRDSAFKQEWLDRYLITAVQLHLPPQAGVCTDYLPLAEELSRMPGEDTPQKVFDAVCRIRRQKLPDPATLANAGSFFKNPIVSADQFQDLIWEHAGIVSWPVDEGFKLAAAWLLEQDGWKGYGDGAVGMHAQQPLVMVNYGGATANDVLDLAARIQDSIRNRFGVELEIEPRIVLGDDA